MDATLATGLAAAEAQLRQRRPPVNRPANSGRWLYAEIVSRNVFTLFNAMIAPVAIGLLLLEDYNSAIAVSSMAVINTTIALAQELRARRHLDRLTILVETPVRVLREGKWQAVSAADVQLGDHVLLAPGEMVVADGTVLQGRFLAVDEALLTGESEPVARRAGELLLSGSICVSGEGAYRAERIADDAFANRTVAQARRYRFSASPLTRVLNCLIRVLSGAAIALCLLFVGLYLVQGSPQPEMVESIAATITSLVPQGLVLTATFALTLAALRMSSRGAVVQRLSAIESMAAVDVLCMDKTGTLTTNQLRVQELRTLAGGLADDEVARRVRLFASASPNSQDRIVQALRRSLGESAVEALDQIPFGAQRRYSAVRVRDGSVDRVLVMGAPEAFQGYLEESSVEGAEAVRKQWLGTGLRVLLVAEGKDHWPFSGTLDGHRLCPLAYVAFSDELRPEAGKVLHALAEQGIALKILSGDNPETVRVTVQQFAPELAREPAVSGDEWEDVADKTEVLRTRCVFGRVSPQQKLAIVEALIEQGHHVAMIGDGVNDVLALKRANLAIAMGDGTQAAKNIAGLVLADNNFALLPVTLEESRILLGNLRRAGKLFLVKNVYSLVLLLVGGTGLFGLVFPYVPEQVTLLNWLVIGIPAFVIALSHEGSAAGPRPAFLREVGSFAVRTGLVFALAGLAILLLSAHVWGMEPAGQRTLLLSTLVLLGVTALFRVLTDGEHVRSGRDTPIRFLALLAVPVYLAVMYCPATAGFFQLEPLRLAEWLGVLSVVLPGYALCLLSDSLFCPGSQRGRPPRAGRAGAGRLPERWWDSVSSSV
jgi:cation-transporting P-type ATPase E